jgi:nucleoside-diphosphate-sugar epimerase
MTVSFRGRDLPFGALVLVTNGTKPIALQVIKQLLERGYRVRTTTGIFANASWLDRLFATYVDSGVFERLTVGDPSHSTAFRKAVRGVDAIVHSATVPLIGPNLDEVERLTAASVFSILSAAEREPSVRAFVYTSSIVAATPLAPSSDVWVEFDTWNRVDAELASSGEGGDCVYNASLAAAEQVVWLWGADRRPHFRVNVISPANIIGQNFGSEYTSDWKNWIFELYMKHHAKGVPGLGRTQPRKSSPGWLAHVSGVQFPLLHCGSQRLLLRITDIKARLVR